MAGVCDSANVAASGQAGDDGHDARFRVRPAREEDVQSLYELAKVGDGGLGYSLPVDKSGLAAKVEQSCNAFSREDGDPEACEFFMFVLENCSTGQIRGTCHIQTRVGIQDSYYVYRATKLKMRSGELNRSFDHDVLTLCTDFDECTELGGLLLHPDERGRGLGLLLGRVPFLFMRQHRPRFAKKVVVAIRGVCDRSPPFWDAVGRRFMGMEHHEATTWWGFHGSQVVADLMPKLPIYTALLPADARAVLGVPHRGARGAARILEREGFCSDGYVDVFDGGPTFWAATDKIRTVVEAREMEVSRIGHLDPGITKHVMLATARSDIGRFASCYGVVHVADADEVVTMDPHSASLLDISPGERVLTVASS